MSEISLRQKWRRKEDEERWSRLDACGKSAEYFVEIETALHEASHAAAALHIGLTVQYAELGWNGVSSGRVCVDQYRYDTGEVLEAEKHIFFFLAAIAMAETYHLSKGGLCYDWQDIRGLLAFVDDPEKVEAEMLQKAQQFVVEYKDQIFRLARALQNHRRLDGDTAARIFNGTEPVEIPQSFLDAVALMDTVTWLDPAPPKQSTEQPPEQSTEPVQPVRAALSSGGAPGTVFSESGCGVSEAMPADPRPMP